MMSQNKKSLEEIIRDVNERKLSDSEKFNRCFHKTSKSKRVVLVECPFTGTLEEMEVDDESGE